MRLIKEFEKLKLTPQIKILYTAESESRKKNVVGNIDEKIAKLYRAVTTCEYTFAWCDAVEQLVAEVSKLNKTIIDRSTKMKEYSQMSTMYKNIRESLSFSTNILEIFDKYNEIAQTYTKIYKDSQVEAYRKLHSSSSDVAKLNRFTQEAWALKEKKPGTAITNLISTDKMTKYNTIVDTATTIEKILLGRTKAYDDINFESTLNAFYSKYMEAVTKCDVAYKKSQKEFFLFITNNSSYGSQLEQFCKEAPKILSQNKTTSTILSADAKNKFQQIQTKYNQFSKELSNKAAAISGYSIEKEIDTKFKNLLNTAKENHSEFDKSPGLFLKRRTQMVLTISGKTLKDINSSLSDTKKKINDTNKKYISNLDVYNNLVSEVKVFQDIEKLFDYYKFIQCYPFTTSTSEYYQLFKKYDQELKSTFKVIKFPFSTDWEKIRKLFNEYEIKIRKEAEEKRKKEEAAKKRKAIITFPFRLIGNIFKYLGIGIWYALTGIFRLFISYKVNYGVKVLMSILVTIICIILSYLGIFKFVHLSKTHLIILAIGTIVMSIICLIGGFKNDHNEDNAGQLVLMYLYPLVPLLILFFGHLVNINIIMLIFVCVALISESVVFLTDLYYADGPNFFLYTIGHLALLAFGLIAHNIMKENSSSKVMYIFYYVYFGAMEIYLMWDLHAQNIKGFEEVGGIICYIIGAILVIVAFLMFSNALWYGAFVVIVGLILEFIGFGKDVDDVM